jgi:hypothetical protein
MGSLYWRKVVSTAWDKTWRLLGWSKEKAVTGVIFLIATAVAGGLAAIFHLISVSLAVIIGVSVAAISIFVWGVIETQAAVYSDLLQISKMRVAHLEAQMAHMMEPPPNYEKWRHVEKFTLRNAAQLWSGLRPQAGLFGEARETYEMLRGAVQNGELDFEPDQSLEPHMREIRIRLIRKNPNADLLVTRKALRTFADLYGYDPPFLRA